MLNHVLKRHIYTVFERLQGWGLHHHPGQPGPVLTTLSAKKFFLIQPKPPLTQLEAIASCPIAGYVGEGTDPQLTTPSCQGAGESDEVSPQPPLLQSLACPCANQR